MLEMLETKIRETCTKCGVGLYDTEIIQTQHGRVLCIYITKAGGVSISDCTRVSKEVSIFLNTDETLVDGTYTLEVSSPGIERPLKYKKHYMSAINEQIKITHNTNEKKENVEGILSEVHQDFIIISIKDDSIHIPFNNIKKAKTCFQKKTKETK